MAATEKRNGVSRRGMTVLGKVPIVPKPINLPSQRSTFCWGRFPNGGGLSGKFESALVDPVSSDDPVQSKLLTDSTLKRHKDGFDLQEKKTQSFGPNSAATNTVGSNSAQKREENKTSGIFEGKGKQETAGPSIQKGGDAASVPPGFSQSGSGNSSNSRTASTDPQCNGVANGLQSETQQSGSQNRSSAKDREIIVIHMVGGPGFYGNFPPHYGLPESYSRNGVPANFPLQFGNFEPLFGLSGHGGPHMPTVTGSQYHDGHENFICYEKECLNGACRDAGRHRNIWMQGGLRDNSFVGGVQGEAANSFRSRSLSHRHLSRNAGRSRSFYQNGRVVSIQDMNSEPAPEKRITLLTKLSHGVHPKNVTGVDKDAESFAGPVSAAFLNAALYDDEGKAPIEIDEDSKVDKVKIEAGLPERVSVDQEIKDVEKDTEIKTMKVLSLKITCNDKCLHCKGAAVTGGSPTSVCQACEKTTVCESSFSHSQGFMESTEEVPVSIAEKDSSVDGCKVDVKHIILDADNHCNSCVESESDCQQRETAKDSDKCPKVSQLNNSEVVDTGTDVLVDTSFTKYERRQKLVYIKKSQLKLLSKPGIRVSKVHVKTKRFGPQGTKLMPATSSNSISNTEESSEVSDCPTQHQAAKRQQDNEVQKINSLPTSLPSISNVSKLGTSAVAPMNEKIDRPEKLVYRKKTTAQASNSRQPRKEESKTNQPAESHFAVVDMEHSIEPVKDRASLTTFTPSFECHIIQRRVHHAVEGSEEHFLSPTAPLSIENNNKKQPGKIEERDHSTLATSSLHCATESSSLQESAVEMKSSDSSTEDTSCTLNCSLKPSGIASWYSRQEGNTEDTSCTLNCSLKSSGIASWYSRQEGNVTKKSEQLSTWRPKAGYWAHRSENSIIEIKKHTNSFTSALVGAGEIDTELSTEGLLGDLNAMHYLQSEEEDTLGNIQGDSCLELKHSSHCASQCEENDQLPNHVAESCVQDEVLENLSESSLWHEEVKGSIRQAQKVLPCSLIMCDSAENLTLKGEETERQEINAEGCKPFVKKKPMSYEKANRYHQMLFRRYKEIGHWKPKTNTHKKFIKRKENVCPNQDDPNLSG